MRKYILSVAVVIEAVLIALGVGLLFANATDRSPVFASAETRGTEAYTTEAPENLARLQSADDGQLSVWAESLESFDGRDYGYVTPADNQLHHNTCWAFAAVGAAEASILREGFDPSVTKDDLNFDDHVAAYTRFNRDGNRDPLHLTDNDKFEGNWDIGSFSYAAFAAMSQGYSLVKEEDYYPYDYAVKDHVAESDYFLQSYIRIPNNPTAIKLAVLKYGAVTMEYKAPSSMYHDYVYYSNGTSTNHASIIVGWDDGVKADAFSPNKPSTDGAWIVKNSWGDHGEIKNGTYCFYLSYESYLTANIYAADLAPKAEYQNLYYYDGQLATSMRNYAAEEQAAIYEAKLTSATEQEQLKAVVVECAQSDLDVNVKIYRNLTVNPGNVNDGINVPVQGEPAAEINARADYMGLYTFDFPTPLDLKQGEYFSIVVKCTNRYGSVIPVPCSADGPDSVNDMTYHCYNGEWTSYKDSYDGYADTSSDNMSARIRAVTNTVRRAAALGNDLQYSRVEIPNRLVYYARGKELSPEISVYFGGELLTANEDYTVKITGNTTPGTAEIEIRGKGDYYGVRKTLFEVAKQKYPPNRMSGTVDVYEGTTMLHEIPIPDDWEWINEDRELEYGRSYFPVSLKYVGDDKEFYRVTTCDFYVNKLQSDPPVRTEISLAEIAVTGEYTYTGKAVIPEISAVYQGRKLLLGVNYTVVCRDNVNAGQATAEIRGLHDFQGLAVKNFEIKKANAENIATDIEVNGKFTRLSDIELPEGFVWDESTFTKVSENVYKAAAVYEGGNYDIERLEFTITVADDGDPVEPPDITADGDGGNDLIWLAYALPLAAVCVAAAVGTAVAVRRRGRR